eukprot:403349293
MPNRKLSYSGMYLQMDLKRQSAISWTLYQLHSKHIIGFNKYLSEKFDAKQKIILFRNVPLNAPQKIERNVICKKIKFWLCGDLTFKSSWTLHQQHSKHIIGFNKYLSEKFDAKYKKRCCGIVPTNAPQKIDRNVICKKIKFWLCGDLTFKSSWTLHHQHSKHIIGFNKYLSEKFDAKYKKRCCGIVPTNAPQKIDRNVICKKIKFWLCGDLTFKSSWTLHHQHSKHIIGFNKYLSEKFDAKYKKRSQCNLQENKILVMW